jgi:hypothetical protein
MRIAQLLGLRGVEADIVEHEADGSWTAHVTTAPGEAVCCPGCGQPADRAKELAAHTFAHLAVVPLRVTWHKRRFWCGKQACQTRAFAESGPAARPRAAVSDPGKTTVGHLGDWMVPVSRVAAAAGVSWHTAYEGFIGVAAEAGIHVEDTKVTAHPDPQPEPQPDPQPDPQPRSRGPAESGRSRRGRVAVGGDAGH